MKPKSSDAIDGGASRRTFALANDLRRRVGVENHLLGVVLDRREQGAEIDHGLGAEPLGDTDGQASHVLLDQRHHLGLHRPRGAGQDSMLRDHIVGVAGLDAGNAQHRGVLRRYIS